MFETGRLKVQNKNNGICLTDHDILRDILMSFEFYF